MLIVCLAFVNCASISSEDDDDRLPGSHSLWRRLGEYMERKTKHTRIIPGPPSPGRMEKNGVTLFQKHPDQSQDLFPGWEMNEAEQLKRYITNLASQLKLALQDVKRKDLNQLLDSIIPVTPTPEETQQGEVETLTMQAHTGNVKAQLRLAQCFQEGRRVAQSDTEAALWYRKAAMQGSSQAKVGIGVMHSQGRGVILNHTKAFEWFQSAALQNEVLGEYHLGKAYFSGYGIMQSYSSAATWYRKAARQDHAKAQYQLGQMYLTGQGVYRSDHQSKRWYKAAAAQGHQDAKVALDAILKRELRKVNSTLATDLADHVPLILFSSLLLPLAIVFKQVPFTSYHRAIRAWYRRNFDWLLSMLSVLLGSVQASIMLLCTQATLQKRLVGNARCNWSSILPKLW